MYFAGMRVGSCSPIQEHTIFAIACNISTWILDAFSIGFSPIYLLFFWILAGQTPGKRLMGLRIVRMNGGRMTLLVGLRRLLGYLVCLLSLGVGFLWVLIDDERRGWHDNIAGTCVVYSWEAQRDDQFIKRFYLRMTNKKGSGQGEPDTGRIQPAEQQAEHPDESSAGME